ncbi:hypothetical protein CFRS1_v004656 [Colletotrichum fructicola]|nr:hypothetical protein CFRS1_v004656 [Colletotrichum fructicola]
MAPASQEPEPASATTTRPDNDSSVDNIAQAYRDLQRQREMRAFGYRSPSKAATSGKVLGPLLPFRSQLVAISIGEQAASALEANLTNLENRLDALLAAFESSEGGAEAPKDTNDTHNGNTPSGQKHNEGSGPDASGAAKKP